jgi:hypothetical protein
VVNVSVFHAFYPSQDLPHEEARDRPSVLTIYAPISFPCLYAVPYLAKELGSGRTWHIRPDAVFLSSST